MRPAVAVTPPNEIIFTSSRFEQMRQTQKITPNVKKGSEKVRFIILVFNVVFKHTEDICPLLFFNYRGAKIVQTGLKTNLWALISLLSRCVHPGDCLSGKVLAGVAVDKDWPTFMARKVCVRTGRHAFRP